ncbi:hypothetical protein ACWCXH_35445 [Kitasatospora sp. NPDC001660]
MAESEPTGFPTSRIRGRDLYAEALAGLLQRPARTLLTMLGTILGVGAFTAILGLTSTTSGQISKDFTVLAATTVNRGAAMQVRGGVVTSPHVGHQGLEP